jgi:hypothetical protein
MIVLSNKTTEDLMINIVDLYVAYVNDHTDKINEILDKFPSTEKLMVVFDEFVDSEDKYIHVYDNKSKIGYLIEKNGSYNTIGNNFTKACEDQLVVIATRSDLFKPRWASGEYTYEDSYALYNCREIHEIHNDIEREFPDEDEDYQFNILDGAESNGSIKFEYIDTVDTIEVDPESELNSDDELEEQNETDSDSKSDHSTQSL